MPHRITRCDKTWSFPSVFTFLVVLSWAFAPLVFAQKDQEKSDETKLVLSALAKRYENLGNWEAT